MVRFLVGAIAFALSMLPAAAQNSPGQAGQVTVPSGQNSGAGIPGLPGSKSGPAVKSPSDTTGSAANPGERSNEAVRQQDPAKIPGQPGSKSGPAAAPSSGANPK